MASSLAKKLAPVAVKWAQCENANCQKWRRLPANAVIDDDAAWYCYMNPDPQHNTCSASEAEYDEDAEFVIPTDQDLQDAQEAEAIKQSIARNIHANVGKGGRRKSEGKSQSGSQRQQSSGWGSGQLAGAPGPGAGALTDGRDSGNESEGLPPRMNWRQLSKHLIRLLDTVGGAAEAPAPAPTLAPELWRELGLRCPEAAELVREAADSASAARSFAPASSQGQEQGTALTQAALTLAAALVLTREADSLPDEERQRLGLDSLSAGPSDDALDPAALRARLARLAA